MKYALPLVIALVLAGCSGASKKGDSAQNTDGATPKSSPQPNANIAPGKTDPKSRSKKKGAPGAKQSGAVVCTLDGLTREISVIENSPGCTVQYTKDGESSEIGRGSSESDFCPNLLNRVKGNLESAGFRCD